MEQPQKEGKIKYSAPEKESLESEDNKTEKTSEDIIERYKEIIIKEDLPFFKPLLEIINNHYGEKLIPLELNKDYYTIKELVDLGWIPEFNDSEYGEDAKIKYDENIDFNFLYKYYVVSKDNNLENSKKMLIGILNDGIGVEELREFRRYGGPGHRYTKLRFEEVTRELINITSISQEILNLIPKDFGEYEFQNVSPWSNSLYFSNKKGYICRISDHKVPEYNSYPSFMIYNIIINSSED
jgi:hypothetical protein